MATGSSVATIPTNDNVQMAPTVTNLMSMLSALREENQELRQRIQTLEQQDESGPNLQLSQNTSEVQLSMPGSFKG